MTATGLSMDRSGVEAAHRLIAPHVRVTPVVEVDLADFDLPPARVVLKLEFLQHAGSFKARGAFANLLTRPIPAVGVAAASGGNHGAAVAYAARRLGVPARIFVPEISSPAKIERIRGYGADLVVSGAGYAEALEGCNAWVSRSGALSIHAFDRPETLCGQGTVALELQSQAPSDTVLAAVGGGGLVSGLAAACQGHAAIVGVEPRASPTLMRALAAGRPVDAEVGGLAADSLAPRRVGTIIFPVLSRQVDRVVLVDDDDIRAAQRALWRVLRVVVEPGGAAAFAALLSGAYRPDAGERIAVVLSGANTTAVEF